MAKKKKGKPKSTLGRLWYFIWEDDSALSWIVNVVLAFVIIKYLVFPGLGFVLGTTYPVVAVVSGSMEHGINSEQGPVHLCGQFYEEKKPVSFDFFWQTCNNFYLDLNISRQQFETFIFSNGFNKGDIIVLLGTKPDKIEVGDVIVFRIAGKTDPIIHRVVKIQNNNNKHYFQTKGDHNPGSWNWETNIPEENVIGRAAVKIPWLGYIKIWVVDFLNLIGIYKYIPI